MIISIKLRVLLFILIVALSILLCLIPSVTTNAEELDISIQQVSEGDHFSAVEGVLYEFLCPLRVSLLTVELDRDYDSVPLTDTIALTSYATAKFGTYTFFENGEYVITALLDGDETIVNSIHITSIDYKAPYHNNTNTGKDNFEFEGAYLAWYRAYVEDQFYEQKQDVSSGLECVIILRDMLSGGGLAEVMPESSDDLDAYRQITPDVIEGLDVDIIARKDSISKFGITRNVYVEFDVDRYGGSYYVYAIDRVGNVMLSRMFDIYERSTYFIELSNGETLDYTEAVQIASERINTQSEEYAKHLIDALSVALDRLKLSFFNGDEDEIIAAATAFDVAQINFTNAKLEFNVVITGSDLFPGAINVLDFNSSSITDARKGDTALLTISLLEYREDNPVFNNVQNVLQVSKAQRLFTVNTQVTLNGNAVKPAVTIKLYFVIPESFKTVGVAIESSGAIVPTAFEKGGEWLTIDVTLANSKYFVIIYDESFNQTNYALYIIIGCSVGGVALIIGSVLLVLHFKKARGKKTISEMEVSEATNINTVVRKRNNRKKR
ncbi:MAG: hypothetical protein LBE09_01785 [Christensenellaceae bacterium]|jgi:hypothetical protein|nr:hypothetical protein [Christensenellaceae bacterium]